MVGRVGQRRSTRRAGQLGTPPGRAASMTEHQVIARITLPGQDWLARMGGASLTVLLALQNRLAHMGGTSLTALQAETVPTLYNIN